MIRKNFKIKTLSKLKISTNSPIQKKSIHVQDQRILYRVEFKSYLKTLKCIYWMYWMYMPKITDKEIIRVFFGNSHGIGGCAGRLNITKIRVAKVILKYKRKHNIR
jgi:hypothetical protein